MKFSTTSLRFMTTIVRFSKEFPDNENGTVDWYHWKHTWYLLNTITIRFLKPTKSVGFS